MRTDAKFYTIGNLVELPAKDFLRRSLGANQDILLGVQIRFKDANGNYVCGSAREIDVLSVNTSTSQIDKGITIKIAEGQVEKGVKDDKYSLTVMSQLPDNGQALRDFIIEKRLAGDAGIAKINRIEQAEISYTTLRTGSLTKIPSPQFKTMLGNRTSFYDFPVNAITPATLGTTKEELLKGFLTLITWFSLKN